MIDGQIEQKQSERTEHQVKISGLDTEIGLKKV